MDIKWLGHSTFKIKTDSLIFIDPWDVKKPEPADILIVSHSHSDHFSKPDINKILKKETVFLTTADCAKEMGKIQVKIFKPGDSVIIGKTKITGFPAYNTNKKFHPKTNNWLGLIIEWNNERLYYSGDTDVIPEMLTLNNISYALMNVGGTYAMTAEEAANAANQFKPKILIPYHYGKIVGDISDARKTAEVFKGDTKILQITE